MAGIAPTPTLTSFSDGQLVSAADLNGISTHLANLFDRTMGGQRSRKPLTLVRAVKSPGTVVIPRNTNVLLSWQESTVDYDGMWDGTSQYLTVNTAGWYRLESQIHWDQTNNGGSRACKILANGTNVDTNAIATDNRNPINSYSGGEGTVTFCQTVARLAVGTKLYGAVSHSASTSTALVDQAGGAFLSCEWLAPYNT